MSPVPASITATFRVSTPLFIGGHDPAGDSAGASRPVCPVRVPSIKGVLRFWWRAIQWHRLRIAAGSDEDALKRLHESEQALFGAAADDRWPARGQSRVLITAKSENASAVAASQQFRSVGYLLGQGLWDSTENPPRLTRSPSRITGITLSLRFHKSVDRKQYESVVEALWILGLLGGLGARSRRGFGSLCLTGWTGLEPGMRERFPVPGASDDYRAALVGIAGELARGDLPPFTAFSGRTRVDLSTNRVASTSDFPGMKVLSMANAAMMNFRRDGKNRQGEELRSTKEAIARDRRLMLGYLDQPHRGIGTLPVRSVFGLPHNYYFGSKSRSIEYSVASGTVSSNGEIQYSLGRRASPLFLHAHAFPDGTCVLAHVLLPARFFPPAEDHGANVCTKRGQRIQSAVADDTQIDWTLLHSYLDIWAERQSICGASEEV